MSPPGPKTTRPASELRTQKPGRLESELTLSGHLVQEWELTFVMFSFHWPGHACTQTLLPFLSSLKNCKYLTSSLGVLVLKYIPSLIHLFSTYLLRSPMRGIDDFCLCGDEQKRHVPISKSIVNEIHEHGSVDHSLT